MQRRLFKEGLQEQVICVSLLFPPNSLEMKADQVQKLIETLDRFGLRFSRQIEARCAAMDREMTGHKYKKGQFVRVR
jgi:hypothetical protein